MKLHRTEDVQVQVIKNYRRIIDVIDHQKDNSYLTNCKNSNSQQVQRKARNFAAGHIVRRDEIDGNKRVMRYFFVPKYAVCIYCQIDIGKSLYRVLREQ